MCHYLCRCSLSIGAFFGCVAWNTCHGALSGEELLELMKANDAQFNNVLVLFDYVDYSVVKPQDAPESGEIRFKLEVDPTVDRTGMPSTAELVELASKHILPSAEGKEPLPAPESVRVWVELLRAGKINLVIQHEGTASLGKRPTYSSHSSSNEMALKWPDFAVLRTFDSDKSQTRFSSVDQVIDNLYSITSHRREWFHSKEPTVSMPNVYQIHVVWLQFSLGIGYGNLIKKIKSVKTSENGFELDVEMEIWPGTTSTASLAVDGSFLVRDALIEKDGSRIIVANQGIFDAERKFKCARLGQFSRFTPKGFPKPKFDVVLKDVQFNITDATFTRISDMSTPVGEPRFEITDDRVHSVGAVSLGYSTGRRWISFLNVIIVCVIILLLISYRRYKPSYTI